LFVWIFISIHVLLAFSCHSLEYLSRIVRNVGPPDSISHSLHRGSVSSWQWYVAIGSSDTLGSHWLAPQILSSMFFFDLFHSLYNFFFSYFFYSILILNSFINLLFIQLFGASSYSFYSLESFWFLDTTSVRKCQASSLAWFLLLRSSEWPTHEPGTSCPVDVTQHSEIHGYHHWVCIGRLSYVLLWYMALFMVLIFFFWWFIFIYLIIYLFIDCFDWFYLFPFASLRSLLEFLVCEIERYDAMDVALRPLVRQSITAAFNECLHKKVIKYFVKEKLSIFFFILFSFFFLFPFRFLSFFLFNFFLLFFLFYFFSFFFFEIFFNFVNVFLN
jgi:hypothetical protein